MNTQVNQVPRENPVFENIKEIAFYPIEQWLVERHNTLVMQLLQFANDVKKHKVRVKVYDKNYKVEIEIPKKKAQVDYVRGSILVALHKDMKCEVETVKMEYLPDQKWFHVVIYKSGTVTIYDMYNVDVSFYYLCDKMWLEIHFRDMDTEIERFFDGD